MRDAWSIVDRITAAASVFVGPYSPRVRVTMLGYEPHAPDVGVGRTRAAE